MLEQHIEVGLHVTTPFSKVENLMTTEGAFPSRASPQFGRHPGTISTRTLSVSSDPTFRPCAALASIS